MAALGGGAVALGTSLKSCNHAVSLMQRLRLREIRSRIDGMCHVCLACSACFLHAQALAFGRQTSTYDDLDLVLGTDHTEVSEHVTSSNNQACSLKESSN